MKNVLDVSIGSYHTVEIETQGRRLLVSKALLCARSSTFRVMLMRPGFKEAKDSVVTLPGIKPQTLIFTILYLSTGILPSLTPQFGGRKVGWRVPAFAGINASSFPPVDPVDVVALADRFMLSDLKQDAEAALAKHTSDISSVCSLLRLADFYNLPTLSAAARMAAIVRTDRVKASRGWDRVMLGTKTAIDEMQHRLGLLTHEPTPCGGAVKAEEGKM